MNARLFLEQRTERDGSLLRITSTADRVPEQAIDEQDFEKVNRSRFLRLLGVNRLAAVCTNASTVQLGPGPDLTHVPSLRRACCVSIPAMATDGRSVDPRVKRWLKDCPAWQIGLVASVTYWTLTVGVALAFLALSSGRGQAAPPGVHVTWIHVTPGSLMARTAPISALLGAATAAGWQRRRVPGRVPRRRATFGPGSR
jgi:hypothetical protein